MIGIAAAERRQIQALAKSSAMEEPAAGEGSRRDGTDSHRAGARATPHGPSNGQPPRETEPVRASAYSSKARGQPGRPLPCPKRVRTTRLGKPCLRRRSSVARSRSTARSRPLPETSPAARPLLPARRRGPRGQREPGRFHRPAPGRDPGRGASGRVRSAGQGRPAPAWPGGAAGGGRSHRARGT